MLFILTGFSLGFLGSFHCIGMCGPIALSLPVHNEGPVKKILLILFYNLGRAGTYAVMGVAAGSLGQLFNIAGYQQALSIGLGIMILLVLVLPKLNERFHLPASFLNVFVSRIKNSFRHLYQRKGPGSFFSIGLLNGLLPCGMVYLGLTGAIATGNILQGALFMGAFGMGTLPVMLALPLAGSFISVDNRNKTRKTVPFVIGLTAILLIFRGLSLGIPYLSPDLQNSNTVCHSVDNFPHKHQITCTGQNSVIKK